jgi:hypothetical protein
MIERCSNPNHFAWQNYGGADPPVMVCDRWLPPKAVGFANFLSDMGERPNWATGGIDRIDPYGNYEPDNCRWVTRAVQSRNRRA